MTSEEIRKLKIINDPGLGTPDTRRNDLLHYHAVFLREIAAQLAELNERHNRESNDLRRPTP